LIEGLTIIQNFISSEEEADLLDKISSELWLNDLKRRVQHYGFRYDYSKKKIDLSMYVGQLPVWSEVILDRIKGIQSIDFIPDQLIVNEYEPGQGISQHVDCTTCFTGIILSLSLGSGCELEFKHTKTKKTEKVYIQRNSLVIMQGEARYNWMHLIRNRKTDPYNGIKLFRETRLSLTFRRVILKR